MTKRILIATIGSLGDLHPFLAIAVELKRRGAHPILAIPTSHVAKAEAAGLEAHAIMADFSDVGKSLGLSDEEAARRVMTNADFLIREILMRSLDNSVAALDALSARADLILGTMFSIGAEAVAAKRGLPYVSSALQPMLLFSKIDPPLAPEFRLLAPYPARGLGLAWNRAAFAIIMAEMKRRYAGAVNAVFARHGLAPLRKAPVFETERHPHLRLGLFPECLAPADPEAVQSVRFTGFPIFDSETGGADAADPELEQFLSAGPPPVIFTLGSFAVYAPGDFYKRSAEAATALGVRAIFLTGKPGDRAQDAHTLTRAYLPHSQVFSRCAAIVHHGGIGTTGQAMRAGRPQLIVPHLGDQYDNGSRIKRLGIGDHLSAKAYTARGARDALERLLADAVIAKRAAKMGDALRKEDGAANAADLLLAC